MGAQAAADVGWPAMIVEPWKLQAACRGASSKTFFPFRGESISAARAICATCAVIADCLGYADGEEPGAEVQQYGVWGGLNQRERRKARGLPPRRPRLVPL